MFFQDLGIQKSWLAIMARSSPRHNLVIILSRLVLCTLPVQLVIRNLMLKQNIL
jgi:hypothetical protein